MLKVAIEIKRSCLNCAYKTDNTKVCKKCDALSEFYSTAERIGCEDIQYIKKPMWKMSKLTKTIVDNPSLVCFIEKLKVKAQTEREYNDFKYYHLCLETLLERFNELKDTICSSFINEPSNTDNYYENKVYKQIDSFMYNIFNCMPIVNSTIKVYKDIALYRALDKVPTLRVTITGTLKWEDTPCFEAMLNVSLTPVVKEIVK